MVMMKCGHNNNGAKITETGKPVCVICYGIVPGATEVEDNVPDLTGRTMICVYNPMASRKPSDASVPFFSHRPDRDEDEYYCGCYGWD